MNSYLVSYQIRTKGSVIQIGNCTGETISDAIKSLEQIDAIIYSVILTGNEYHS